MAKGAAIDYRVRVGPLSVRWRARIASWKPGRGFVDLQESGPYRFWWHEHSFRADGDRTVMDDCVYYATPFGMLGRLANRLFIGPTLKQTFRYRGKSFACGLVNNLANARIATVESDLADVSVTYVGDWHDRDLFICWNPRGSWPSACA